VIGNKEAIMSSYILAGAVVLVVKWISAILLILFYRMMRFCKPSSLYSFKEEVGRTIINILSNITAVYVFVVLFNELQLQLAIGMLVIPLLVGMLWGYYNLQRARQGISACRQAGEVFYQFREQMESQYGKAIAEAVTGNELKRRFLIRSEYAYSAGNVFGTILGAILFLRNAPFF
jgi:hypothetical protein